MRATNDTLPSGNVIFAGGTLHLSGTFTRALGTGPDEIDLSGNATSFSAVGGDLTLNFGGAGATINYGDADFRPAGGTNWVLNGSYATHNLTVVNPVTFSNGGNDTITVNAGIVTFQGAINKQANALFKAGAGTLVITTDSRASTGVTRMNGGMLVLPDLGKLSRHQINGGVLGVNADYTRSLSNSSTSGVQWGTSETGGADGGFAAWGGDRVVALGGLATPTALTWDSTANFLRAGQTFILSHIHADGTIDFRNAIDFNGAARTVRVDDGSAPVDAILSGVLSGTGSSGLTKTGAGTLALTAAITGADNLTQADAGTTILNAANTYTGGTTIAAGILEADNGTALGSSGNITFTGGTLRFTANGAGAVTSSARLLNWEATMYSPEQSL